MYTVCSLFAGAGGIDLAFQQAGAKVVWANESDKDACITYRLNFPETVLAEQDIRSVNTIVIPDFDIIVGGFPCQPFSLVGKEKGFQDDRGNLFFEICRVIDAKKPKAIMLENVANLLQHDNGNTIKVIRHELTSRGYTFQPFVADAQDYGFPQRRNRVYIVCFQNHDVAGKFQFPEKCGLEKYIFDILDRTKKAPDWCYLNQDSENYKTMRAAIKDKNQLYRFSDGRFAQKGGVLAGKNGIAFTLLAGMGNWHDREPIIEDDYGIRRLTPQECFLLQGYPESFKLDGVPRRSAYRQAGNTVCVPVVEKIARSILSALDTELQKKTTKNPNEPVSKADDTLIGIVRGKNQLEACLKKKFYHFPADKMNRDIKGIKYLALYLSSSQSGSVSGVRYYAEIESSSVVPRSAIKEIPKPGNTPYCYIKVKDWIECPPKRVSYSINVIGFCSISELR